MGSAYFTEESLETTKKMLLPFGALAFKCKRKPSRKIKIDLFYKSKMLKTTLYVDNFLQKEDKAFSKTMNIDDNSTLNLMMLVHESSSIEGVLYCDEELDIDTPMLVFTTLHCGLITFKIKTVKLI